MFIQHGKGVLPCRAFAEHADYGLVLFKECPGPRDICHRRRKGAEVRPDRDVPVGKEDAPHGYVLRGRDRCRKDAGTRVHVELIKGQESAAGRDVDRFRELEAQVEFAGERRESARAAIKAHLAHFHGQSRTLTA